METMNNPRIALRDTIPIGLGYLAISFAFGIMSSGAGLSIWETVLISMTNLTSAGQLAAVPIIAGGGSLIELALTQLIINLRYSLMSISISQKFDSKIKLRDRFLIAFTLTDEIYAVGIGHEAPLGKKYLFTALISPYIGWTLGTLLGAVAGQILPSVIVSALGVAMYAMFVAIIIPAAKEEKPIALLILAAILLSCLFRYTPLLNLIPEGFVIIICAVSVSVIFALLFPIKDESVTAEEVPTK